MNALRALKSPKEQAIHGGYCNYQVKRILQKLESDELHADFTLYTSLLTQCTATRSDEDARRIHEYIVRDGFDRETVVCNLVVRMYGACGCLDEAKQVFTSLPTRNVFSYNIMLGAYAGNGHLQDARTLFERMPGRTDVSWTAMISAYARNGRLKEARRVFDEIPQNDKVAWNAMITAYAQSEHCMEAIGMFREMDLKGLQPDKITFISVLNCCASTGCIELGRELHEDVVHLDMVTDVSVQTALVSMYGKCRKLDHSERIFNQMHEKNVVSWTAMVAAYAQNGHIQKAKRMFENSPTRNDVTWNSMLAAYAQNEHLQDARDVFVLMPMYNAVSWNTLITAYAQNGHLDEANEMFKKLPHPSVISWNSIISANAQNGQGEFAVKLLREMDLEGIGANRVTFLAVLEACSSIGDSTLGKVMHSVIRGMDFENHYTIATALVTMYARCGGLEDAKSVFDRGDKKDVMLCNSMLYAYTQNGHMQEAVSMFERMNEKNTVSWNLMLTGHVQNGGLDEAEEMFEGMPEKDVVSNNSMMLGYAQVLRVNDAFNIFNEMPEKNLVSWNTMATAYAQNGFCSEAWDLFKRVDMEGLQPNAFTYVAALEALAGLSSARDTQILHGEIVVTGYISDTSVATGLLNVYGKYGNLTKARSVFRSIRAKNMISWNAMMTAYAQNGHSRTAVYFFGLLQLDGLEPDAVTYITAISACSQAGIVENAREHFVDMKDEYGIQPNADHYACMVDLLGRAGRLRQAYSLIQNMPFEPESSTYTSLLNACSMHGNLEIACLAGEHVDMEAGPYMLLSNLYRSICDLDKAVKLTS